MRKPASNDAVTLTLVPVTGPDWLASPERRLAKLLKLMLRSFGWRCVEFRPAGRSDVPDAPAKPPDVTKGQVQR